MTLAADLVASLTSLVGFATESRQTNLDLLDWVADRAVEAGGRVTVVPGAPGRANLLASFGPDRHGGLLLSGHSDVVPAGEGWATPPYTVTQVDDVLRGRGTADMKGFIAVALHALASVDIASLHRPVHLALSYDEEIGCAGVGGLLDHLATTDTVRPALVLIGEPTMMRPRNRHLGKLGYELDITAQAGHSSRSHSLPSSITGAARIVGSIDALNEQHRPAAGAEPVVSLNCGVIRGGQTLNVIADQCHLSFELRFSADVDPDELLAPVREAIAAEAELLQTVGGDVAVHEITRYPALHTDATHPLVALVERIADAGPATAIGYGTEGGLYARALEVPVVICGPGDIAVAHRADEYVSVEQLLRCHRMLGSLIGAVCASG